MDVRLHACMVIASSDVRVSNDSGRCSIGNFIFNSEISNISMWGDRRRDSVDCCIPCSTRYAIRYLNCVSHICFTSIVN